MNHVHNSMWITNRDKKRFTKPHKSYYCGNCDRDAVQASMKCKTCGIRDKSRKRNRKDEKINYLL